MTYVQSINDIEVYLRKMIAHQAEIELDKVLNGLSFNGQDLTKDNGSITESIDRSDTLIIFELQADTNNNVVSFIEDNNKISNICSYKLHLVIYGNESQTVAQKLKSRFETEKVYTDMQNVGISITDISNIQSINEVINDTIWQRSDLDINISCCLEIEQVDPISDFAKIKVDDIAKC